MSSFGSHTRAIAIIETLVGVGDADPFQHLDRTPTRDGLAHLVVHPVRLDDLLADRVERVQRRQRVLEDHRHLVAAQRPHVAFAHADEFPAFEPDLAGDLS
jgi:hypothetical protein